MPTDLGPGLFDFAPVDGCAVVADFDGGAITSNAGALLLGATDRAIGVVGRFAACIRDARAPERVEHAVATLVGQRVLGIALGYEDLVDHDQLRHDPVLAVLAGKLAARRADCAPLAGKSTLNRLEHAPSGEPGRYRRIGHDAAAIEALFVDLFLDAHRSAPRQIVLDLDATDVPLYGHQEDRFFHRYYDAYCYLPLYVFCGMHPLAAKLRHGRARDPLRHQLQALRGRLRARLRGPEHDAAPRPRPVPVPSPRRRRPGPRHPPGRRLGGGGPVRGRRGGPPSLAAGLAGRGAGRRVGAAAGCARLLPQLRRGRRPRRADPGFYAQGPFAVELAPLAFCWPSGGALDNDADLLDRASCERSDEALAALIRDIGAAGEVEGGRPVLLAHTG